MKLFVAILALSAISISTNANLREPIANNNPSINSKHLPTTTNRQETEKDKKKPNASVDEQAKLQISEIARMFPEAVVTRYKMVPAGKGNFKTVKTQEVDYQKLTSILAKSLYEQQEAVMRFEREIDSLKKRK